MKKTTRREIAMDDRPINLTQVLKRANVVASGGEAKLLITDGRVHVNGEVEFRKRRQMAVGDVIKLEGCPELLLVPAEPLVE
jgi:ribosome-associated protein